MAIPIHIDKVIIAIVDHSQQRYNTIGDWQLQDSTLMIRASFMPDNLHWPIVGHELVEALWCIRNGVTQSQVDAFDAEFEKTARGNAEPGDSPRAPYYEGHQQAIVHERLLVTEMGYDWAEYSDIVDEPYLKRRAKERRPRRKETIKR